MSDQQKQIWREMRRLNAKFNYPLSASVCFGAWKRVTATTANIKTEKGAAHVNA